ncbi:mucin-2-like [Lineus longissimus]|uniref:mucin-2-like n=1 Tax=Lineus longissimus TaxID=88925 RepID=UPI002B4CD9F7
MTMMMPSYVVVLLVFAGVSSAADPSAPCPNYLTASKPDLVHTFSSSSLCYNTVLEKTKWQTAHSVCRVAGGNLVTIHDNSTQAMLLGQLGNINAASSWNFWIGLYPLKQSSDNNHFTWVDGGDCSFKLQDTRKVDCEPDNGEAYCTNTSRCCYQESKTEGVPWCYYPTVERGRLPFDDWAPDEPSRDAENSCALLWHDHGWKWDDQNCDVAHFHSDIGYICQFVIPPTISTAETTTALAVSPTTRPTTGVSCEKQISTAVDVIEGKSYCYDVVLNALSWNAAYEKCRTAGGSLVAIKDNITQKTLVQELGTIPAAKNSDFWVGLYPYNHEQEYFTWADGPTQCSPDLASTMRVDCHKHDNADEQSCTNLGCCWKTLSKNETGPWCYYPSVNNGQLPFAAWATDQPSKDHNITEFCVLLWSPASWTWDDQDCGNTKGYICEFVKKDVTNLPPTVVASTEMSSPAGILTTSATTTSQTAGIITTSQTVIGTVSSQISSVTVLDKTPSHTIVQTLSATRPSSNIVQTPSQTEGITTPTLTPSLTPSQTSSLTPGVLTTSATTKSQTTGVIAPSQTIIGTVPSQISSVAVLDKTPSHTLVQTPSAIQGSSESSPSRSATTSSATQSAAMSPSLKPSATRPSSNIVQTPSQTKGITTPTLTPSQTSSLTPSVTTSNQTPSTAASTGHTTGVLTPSMTASIPTGSATSTFPSQTASVTPSQTEGGNDSSTFSVTMTPQTHTPPTDQGSTNGSFQIKTTPANGTVVDEPQALLSQGVTIGISVLVIFLIAVGLFAVIYMVRRRMLQKKEYEGLDHSNEFSNAGYDPVDAADGELDDPVKFFNEG